MCFVVLGDQTQGLECARQTLHAQSIKKFFNLRPSKDVKGIVEMFALTLSWSWQATQKAEEEQWTRQKPRARRSASCFFLLGRVLSRVAGLTVSLLVLASLCLVELHYLGPSRVLTSWFESLAWYLCHYSEPWTRNILRRLDFTYGEEERLQRRRSVQTESAPQPATFSVLPIE